MILGTLLGLIARVWLWTLRIDLEVSPEAEAALRADRPLVFAFLHGKQWPLLAWKKRRATCVMVSLSKDGAMQARALGILGFTIVRGSSSRDGARGLAGVVRALKRGQDAAFAIDGPRGPYGVAKPGVLLAAKASGAAIVPLGSAVRRGKVFHHAWDRFALAWPFTKVSVCVGRPSHTGDVAEMVEEANARAEAILAGSAASMVPI